MYDGEIKQLAFLVTQVNHLCSGVRNRFAMMYLSTSHVWRLGSQNSCLFGKDSQKRGFLYLLSENWVDSALIKHLGRFRLFQTV